MYEYSKPSLLHKVRVLLEDRNLPWILALASMMLVLPSVWTGLQFDDLFQRHMLLKRQLRSTDDASLTGMFTFADGNAKEIKRQMNIGIYPWWTFEELRIKFFRPLSEITHILDYRWWPNSPAFMHIHSILWFGLMVGAASVMYRNFAHVGWVAGLAACLYAFDDAHGLTAGWIAQRNATIATFFGILTLLFHHRWRHDGWRPASLMSPLCFALGLLASEGAVATGAYLIAFELFLGPKGLLRKFSGLLPYGLIGIAWFVAYSRLGFGSWGSGAYLDPAKEPWLYARALLERGPLLLYGQWFNFDPILAGLLPGIVRLLLYVGGAVCFLATLTLLVPLLKRDKTARFWALGMVLSLAPISATFASNRLLNFVGLGAMGLLAQMISSWFMKEDWLPSSRGWRGLAQVFVFVSLALHLVKSPISLPIASISLDKVAEVIHERPLKQLLEDFDTSGKTLVLVNSPTPNGMYFLIHYLGEILELPVPDRLLAPSENQMMPTEITRIDANTIEFAFYGGFENSELSKMFRGPLFPMQIGQRVVLSDMVAEVIELDSDELPSRVRFTFLVPLEDPSLLLVAWNSPKFAPFEPPNIGETVHLTQQRRWTRTR